MMIGKIITATLAISVWIPFLTGCANSSSTTKPTREASVSEEPRESAKPKPIFTPGLDYKGEILLDKNDLEKEFLSIALASCEKAQIDGFVSQQGEVRAIFKPSDESHWPDWPFEVVTVTAGKANVSPSYDYIPGLLVPCDLEIQAHRVEATAVLLEHKVTKEDATTYVWAQHNGGENLDEMKYTTANGLISGWGNGDYLHEVTYGPLQEEDLARFYAVTE